MNNQNSLRRALPENEAYFLVKQLNTKFILSSLV